VAKMLGVTPQHIYKMAKAGLIPVFSCARRNQILSRRLGRVDQERNWAVEPGASRVERGGMVWTTAHKIIRDKLTNRGWNTGWHFAGPFVVNKQKAFMRN